MLLLVTAPPSPFGRKVAVALHEKQLAFDVAYDLPWDAGARAAELNPFEQVPVLIAEDGERVFDSSFILEWIEATFPERPLLPQAPAPRLEARKRQMLSERLMLIAQSLVLETYREAPSQAWIDRQQRKITAGLAALDAEYRGREVADAERLDLGDIAAGATLLMFEFMVEAGLSPPRDEFRWRGRHDALARLGRALETRPSFQQTLPSTMAVDLDATMGQARAKG